MAVPDLEKELEWLQELVYQHSQLVEISLTLNSTLEPDRLPQLIIKMATNLLNSEGASILLLDENTHDLYFAAATGGDPAELRSVPVPMDGSIAGSIFRNNKPLIINEVANDPRHFQQVDAKTHLETRSLIGVPMQIRNEVIGVLEALNKRKGEFTEDDVRSLEIIASQAAVAINNARLLDALKRAYEELGRLDRMKTDFISIASHELRTPLGVIMGYAALLKEEAGGESSEHAETVLNQALRMRSLIEDMTNINTLKVGSAELDLHSQPLQDPVRSAESEVKDLIAAKGQQLSIHMPDKPLMAMIDGAKVSMALVNLLNNAMRFTPTRGQIQLRVDQHGSEGWLQVADTGMGISADQVDKIFDQFYQVEDHLTRRHEGMGLGLSIVKAIAEAHGGRVWAASDGLDHGTTFTIALPMS